MAGPPGDEWDFCSCKLLLVLLKGYGQRQPTF